MKTHQITSHDMTWHLATNHITSPHVTSQPTAVLHRSLQPTTSKQVTTSPPWNGWRLVHSKNSVWASQWLVTLCAFYRQILSLTYSVFSLKLPPPACPALLVNVRQYGELKSRWKADRWSKVRRWSRARRKKIHPRQMLEKSRNAVFFQWFVCRVSRKVGSLKRRVRSHVVRGALWREAHFEVKMYKKGQLRSIFCSSDVEKLHAAVARSTFPSQNVKKN